MNLNSAWMLLRRSLVSNLTNMDAQLQHTLKQAKTWRELVQVHTLFLHACQYLDISDIVEFVGVGRAH